MPRLTRRQLRTYVLAIQMPLSGHDTLYALVPFFEPAFVNLRGQIFDPSKFLNSLPKIGVRFNLTTDIVHLLIPKFVEVGWLREEATYNMEAIYRCTENAGSDPENLSSTTVSLVNEIGSKFFTFVKDLDPLSNLDFSQSQLENLLLNWLVSVDASDREEIASVAGSIISTEETEERSNLNWDSALSSTEIYLCARFVQHLSENNDELFSALSEITSVALLTDILLDFHYPKAPDSVDLTLILDAPFLLAVMGMSGKELLKNAQMIVKNAKRLGCRLATFEHCIKESEQNFHAVLSQQSIERYGPTGDALRRGEVSEKLVREILADIEGLCEELKVSMIRQTLEQTPNQRQYFDDDHVQMFYSRINWHSEHVPRDRDASSMALVMRKRMGHRTNDMLKSKYVMISSNPIFSGFSRRFCKERSLLGKLHVPPVMHQSQVATILWLSTGETGVLKISRQQLLLACENALRSRQEIFAKAREEVRKLDNEDQREQLELL